MTIKAEDVLRNDPENESLRAEWDRTAFARAVALRVVRFRVDHDLSKPPLDLGSGGAVGDRAHGSG